MSMHDGKARVHRSVKDLLMRWEDVKGDWDDAMSKRFEERFIALVLLEVKEAVGAMDRTGTLLNQIRRDCE